MEILLAVKNDISSLLQPGTRVQINKPKISKARYEISSANQPIAWIDFPKTFGTLAETGAGEDEWTFKRMGFWKPFITVRKKNESRNLYEIPFSGRWQGIMGLTSRNGIPYELIQKGFWNPRWIWMKYQQPVIEYDLRHGMKKFAEATIHQYDEMTPMLLLLGAYGLIMQSQDEGASAATITAIG